MLSSYSDTELIGIISELAEIKDMRVTINRSCSSGLIVGTAATLGGFLLGPWGIALGGTVAGVSASLFNEGRFRSIPDILMNDLTEGQQRRLADSIRSLLTQRNIISIAALSMEMTSETGLRKALELIIKGFLKELNFSI